MMTNTIETHPLTLSIAAGHGNENPFWDGQVVMAHMMDAAEIHRRLPPVKVQGYFTLMPEPLRDHWDRWCEALNGKPALGPPMPAEVTYHETIMETLRQVDRRLQSIIWSRANRIPWKALVHQFGQSQSTLDRQKAAGLQKIASYLNVVDPGGREITAQRQRANGLATAFLTGLMHDDDF